MSHRETLEPNSHSLAGIGDEHIDCRWTAGRIVDRVVLRGLGPESRGKCLGPRAKAKGSKQTASTRQPPPGTRADLDTAIPHISHVLTITSIQTTEIPSSSISATWTA
ncbi:MAG: hypothetical protein DYH08_03155 [Actinobacteria bacterium ATB1]|nr:hypothetical protein [Actinobacteria bacterium ATB1]